MRPILHIEFLKSLYDSLETYTRWPAPYCNVANDCRRFIRTEAESPGAAFRRRLFKTLPLLNAPTHGMNQPGGKYTEMLKLWHEFGNTTVVFHDIDVDVTANECRPEVLSALMEFDPTRPGPDPRFQMPPVARCRNPTRMGTVTWGYFHHTVTFHLPPAASPRCRNFC